MERNFNNDFERILKEHSDQYRMYPSEKVWKGIYKAMHPGKRWFGLGALLLLVSGTFVTLIMIDQSEPSPSNITSSQPRENLKNDANSASDNTPVISQNNSLIVGKKENNMQDPASRLLRIPVTRVDGIETSDPTETDFSSLSLSNYQRPLLGEASFPVSFSLSDQLTDQDFYTNGFERVLSTGTAQTLQIPKQELPWTVESVTNIFKKKKNKISLQAYFTPTISYRKLRENKAFIRTAAALNPGSPPNNYPALYDINTAVTDKPDIGLEVGVAGKYAVTNNLKLRAGVQFNISRYAIKAFNNPEEIATIALNNGYYGGQPYSTTSNYRNFNGEVPGWLQNFYFQVSTPIGAELKLAGNDQVQFGIASTIQPTYILGDRAYLLTTDYKNYAEVPWLIRRWNVNTNFETFVAYSTGRLNWQVGPQVRYQLMSSFVKKYPVKENLFDFGLKVGVSLNNNQ